MKIEIIKINPLKLNGLVEVLEKEERPYFCKVVINDEYIALIPFRSHLNHKYCFRTHENKGIDYTKSIIVHQDDLKDYILSITSIENQQWRKLNQNQLFIKFQYMNYINKYKKMILKEEYHSDLVRYSTLQNFHKELNLNQLKKDNSL